jgi:hypothetical protein
MPQVLIEDTGKVSTSNPSSVTVVTVEQNGRVPALATGDNPIVSITAPADGSTLNVDETAFLAEASDSDGIDYVEFYVNDVLKATESNAPYGFGQDTPLFDLSSYENGDIEFRVKAFDTLGNFSEVTHTVTLDIVEGGGGTPGIAT